jgi:hypothetical protein
MRSSYPLDKMERERDARSTMMKQRGIEVYLLTYKNDKGCGTNGLLRHLQMAKHIIQ